jgi:hypothetical protein
MFDAIRDALIQGRIARDDALQRLFDLLYGSGTLRSDASESLAPITAREVTNDARDDEHDGCNELGNGPDRPTCDHSPCSRHRSTRQVSILRKIGALTQSCGAEVMKATDTVRREIHAMLPVKRV